MHVLDPFFSDQAMVLEDYYISGIGGHIWPNRFCT